MKWLLLRIAAILLCAGLLLAILFASSELPNSAKNGFLRSWLPYKPVLLGSKALDDNIVNFCGVSNELIYLSGSNPNYVLVLGKDLSVKDTLSLHISIPEEQLVPGTIQVYNDYLYLHAHNSKWLVQGNLTDKKLMRQQLQTEAFAKSIQFSKDKLYIRTISPHTGRPVFQKINATTGKVVHEIATGDGGQDFGIGSDGMFTFNEKEKTIFFVRYLNNKITVLDTSPAIIRQGHTIDTTWSNNMTVYQTSPASGQHNIAPSISRKPVNRFAFTRNNKLYIVSELRADNEKRDAFHSNHVIDVYNCENLDYLGSFNIPKRKKRSFKAARFSGDSLFVLFEGEIAFYDLPD